MDPASQLTALQVVVLGVIAGGVATLIGAGWWLITERFTPQGTDASLWQRILILEQDIRSQAHEIDELRQEKLADREEKLANRAQIVSLTAELDDMYNGLKMLVEQLEAANLTPIWRTHRRSPSTRIEDRALLAGRIANLFSLDEMNGLAFDVGIEPEDIGGETRHERARQIVDAARRLERMPTLERRVKELRP